MMMADEWKQGHDKAWAWIENASDEEISEMRKEIIYMNMKYEEVNFELKYGFKPCYVWDILEKMYIIESLTSEYEALLMGTLDEITALFKNKDKQILELERRTYPESKNVFCDFEDGAYRKIGTTMTEDAYADLKAAVDKLSRETGKDKKACMSAIVQRAARKILDE